MEITDNHFHLDPNGLQEVAVKDFLKAGGTRLVLVNKPYGSWKRLDDFKRQVKITMALAKKAREAGAKVGVVASPHPIDLIKLLESNSEELGDVYISVDRAREQAYRYRISMENELHRLLIHGCLHLLGYDHKNSRDRKEMRDKEQFYFRQNSSMTS